jgi:hypothetical protein
MPPDALHFAIAPGSATLQFIVLSSDLVTGSVVNDELEQSFA